MIEHVKEKKRCYFGIKKNDALRKKYYYEKGNEKERIKALKKARNYDRNRQPLIVL